LGIGIMSNIHESYSLHDLIYWKAINENYASGEIPANAIVSKHFEPKFGN